MKNGNQILRTIKHPLKHEKNQLKYTSNTKDNIAVMLTK